MADVGKTGYSDSTQSYRTGRTEKRQGDTKTQQAGYGKTIGEPELSDKAAKYYDQLKKKFGNYDFILVSKDQKENAKANAAQYANKFKTVVLIDEEKIEKMATDANFRKKYENILSGASSQLAQLKSSLEKSGANVKGYGMQVDDGGTLSFFAVLKKSSADQKARIEKAGEKKKAEKKAAARKAEKKEQEKRLKEARSEKVQKEKVKEEDDETVTISANSVEELMKKLEDHAFAERSNMVQTESEMAVGQHIDFRG